MSLPRFPVPSLLIFPAPLHSKYFPFSTRMERKESGEKEEEISSQQVMITWRPESSRRR